MALKHAEFIPTPGPEEMRRTTGRFVTGVAIVTADDGQEPVGMAINSLTPISLEPPILMIALNFNTRTGDAIENRDAFAVSILNSKQEPVVRQFATRGGARFDDGDFDHVPSGLPVVGNALAQLDCRVVQMLDVGDHRVFFGEVTNCRDREGSGLTYAFSSGKFGAFQDFGHEPMPWHA